MSATVFCAVLLAAAMHAGWNAVVKTGRDRYVSITLIALGGAVVSAAALPFVEIPQAAAWSWLTTSAALQIGYNLFLIEAYRTGDLGQVYPIARGSAPLLVSLVTVPLLGEALDPVATAGLLVLSAGICLMAFGGGRSVTRIGGRSIAFALGTSAFIATYTITDGIGSRINGSPHGYAAWLFFLDGTLMLLVLLARRGVAGLRALAPVWRPGLAGGAMSLAAYWIVIWAMTRAPIGLVAALRESSVLFAASISVVILREPLTVWRSVAGLTIMAGIALARIG